MHTRVLARLLMLLVPTLLMLGTDPAEAQRREKQEATEPAPALFPQASREEPKQQASQRLQRDLQRMYDAAQKEDFETVLELAEKVTGNARANPYERSLAHQNAAYALLDLERDAEAQEQLRLAIEAGGLSNDIHFQVMAQLSQMHAQSEEYEPALQWIDRLIAETRTDRADYHMLKANALYQLERFEEAARVARAVVERSEEPKALWVQLVMAAYADIEQPLKAAEFAETQLQRFPNDKAMLMNLASLYIDADRYDEAARTLDLARARGLLTEERDYRQLYRLYLNIEGKENSAVEVINEGMQKGVLQPGLEVYNILGQAYYFSDRTEQAISAWTEADKFAEDGEVALNLARVLYNEERYPASIEAARRALEKGVKRPGEAWIVIGNAEYFGNNSRSAGVAAYREAAKYPETKEQAETWLRQSRNM